MIFNGQTNHIAPELTFARRGISDPVEYGGPDSDKAAHTPRAHRLPESLAVTQARLSPEGPTDPIGMPEEGDDDD